MQQKYKMKKILLIDNYDSFTYNLVHAIYDITGQDITVKRNDQLELSEVDEYEYLIFSPGPGIPNEAGLLKEIIRTYAKTKKMLGVCLGHQAIYESFDGKIHNLEKVYHGVSTKIIVTDKTCALFNDLESSFDAGRYHSWVGTKDTLPDALKITCQDEAGQIMGVQHVELPIYGVQFHPESILTPLGNNIIENFLKV